jgi:SAM-dependent methyltransferase
MPLAGDFQSTPILGRLFPLAIDVCAECGLLQVRDLVDPSIIFSADYSYASSTVPGLVRHFRDFAAKVRVTGPRRPLLLEIGCNDGVFLEPLREAGYDVVGVDASDNVASMARARGLDVRTAFFSSAFAEELVSERGKLDVVTCSNVFAHNPDVNGFVDAVRRALKVGTGEFWIEVHSAHALFEGLQWDCFYHEHCFYWTIGALSRCLRRHGFALMRFETTPMHGGALRAVFAQQRAETAEPAILDPSVDMWTEFGRRCHHSRALIRDAIAALPINYAYGAAGRAVTLINWAQLADRLAFVVDGSPLRYGRFIPNTRVPVISETELSGRPEINDWCFVTAHNYLADIRRKMSERFPDRRFHFVTPLPNVQIQ